MNTTNNGTNAMNYTAPTLSTSAILVHLHIGLWGDNKQDKQKTEELTSAERAKRGSARVNKSLLPDCPELKAVASVGAKARNYLKSVSFLWTERAHRLLPMSKYQEVIAEMRVFEQEFNEAADALVPVYVTRQYEAQQALGGLYDPADYPSASEVRACFKFVLEFAPVPEAGHFVVDLQNQAKDELIEQFSRVSNHKWAAAFAGACEEFRKCMQHLVEKIDDKDDGKQTRMYPSLIPNIRRLIEKVRTANEFEGNADVEAVAAGLESLLSNVSLEALKTNESTRIKVREGVNDLLSKFDF